MNIKEPYYLKLKSKTNKEQVYQELKDQNILSNSFTFDLVCKLITQDSIPQGSYKITPTMDNLTLVQKLKNGYQDPINFTLSSATTIEDIAQKVGQKLNIDSTFFMQYILTDSTLNNLKLTKDNALTLFLPTTLEMYWDIKPSQFIKKFRQENDKFWTSKRMSEAKNLHLTPTEVYILASLVQKEYNKKEERSRIAGVLINRLKINMPLQVDATCKYATKDFAAKRVTLYHTKFLSPYNTYLNIGLPPGPICMPELATIDAVLSVEQHDYLYYCADPSLNGFHIFSKSLSEHEQVAHNYHQKIDQLHIK